MAGAETSSFTQGCFLFEARRCNSTNSNGEGFPKLQGESNEFANARLTAHKSCLLVLNRKLEDVMSAAHNHVITGVVSLVLKSYSDEVNRGRTDVPVAAVVSGVTCTESLGPLDLLIKCIRQHVTPHIATLSSKDCQNMKTLMKHFAAQLISDDDDEQSTDEASDLEEEAFISAPNKKVTKHSNFSMPVLSAWYQETGSMCRIREDLTGASPPVVVVLEDFEGFHSVVLGDFLQICSRYVDKLPLFIILGIQTSVSVIDECLSRSSLSVLRLEVFQCISASMLFDQFVDKVLFSPDLPFKIGHNLLQELAEQFLFYTHSIHQVNKGLQVAMLEHFSKMPASMLCQFDVLNDKTKQQAILEELSHEQLDQIRSLRSFRKFVEESTPLEQKILLLDDNHAKKTVVTLLDDVSNYQIRHHVGTRCLHHLTSKLPKSLLGNKLWELYVAVQTPELTMEKKLQRTIDLLRQASSEVIVEWLEPCLSELKTASESIGLKNDEVELNQRIEVLRSQQVQLSTTSADNSCSVNDTEGSTKTSACEELSIQAKTTAERKMLLANNLQRATNKQSNLSRQLAKEAVNQVCDWLELFFKSCLRHSKSVPLNEIFYFDSNSMLSLSHRAALQRALTDPYSYLKTTRHKKSHSPSGIDPHWPDTCIVYKLYEECSRLINLYDWMQAFISVVSQLEETVDRSKRKQAKLRKKAEINTNLHARFIRAVSELQFLGFVKATKRKTDHVERLTWGLF
ncbi:origin recognition complex subunit 3-like isoform X2 [Corticium candelabrum]|uniref:origin recognition complex subunit 3-like isoform X2 n=1 Tax=Corticium candelabrum TaxID=121492 RepID=UPI002E2703FD|nr:origin recognition complex subunit 3-like isoform X2 [Corticium candelabrum]